MTHLLHVTVHIFFTEGVYVVLVFAQRMQGGARMATTKILFYSSTFYKKENKTAHSAVDKNLRRKMGSRKRGWTI